MVRFKGQIASMEAAIQRIKKKNKITFKKFRPKYLSFKKIKSEQDSSVSYYSKAFTPLNKCMENRSFSALSTRIF